jgi:benzoyl-CoA reductase/2-hydroxyglutaryl-CoA dehydratase subunit BcrC/BadD/HgdB
MMREQFAQLVPFLDQRLAERPRGFDLFSRELLSQFVRAFDENTTTVYVSGYAFPMELLWAFDTVVPFDFEIACNNLPVASGGQGSTIMKIAEREGYARDVCSFDRLIIGCDIDGMLPRGDLYLTSSYYCHGKAKANEIVALRQGKESVLLDVPNEAGPAAVRYVTEQLQDIAARLESVTGQTMDMERLRAAIRSSNRARAALLEMNDLMKSVPCPWDGTRACLLSLAGAVFWGSPVLERIYALLIGEMKDRIAKGTALPESFRILWFPWVPVQQTNIFTILKDHQVSVPMAEVAECWWSPLDEERPLEALARKVLENYMLGPATRRVESLLRMAEAYGVDGAIHFATPACHHDNASFRIISDAMQAKDIPVLNLEGDMTDERNYSPALTASALGSFLEILRTKAAGGKG